MDGSIFLEDLEFLARHGVYDFERSQLQKFLVSVRIFGNFSAATRSDDIASTIDYSKVYSAIKQTVEGNEFHLIERLAGEIASDIFAKFPMAVSAEVAIKKHPLSLSGIKYGKIGFSAKFSR
ncbi:MAG: dihydroneopterin aldolase [Puniceicoccales bacterium]|jgi:dihydroneopterin aldolase|nr:dihydroneopterin aldolase [Puniceicoccales bacterium]